MPADLQAAQPDAPLERVHSYLDDLNQAITDEVVDSGLAFLILPALRSSR